MHSILNNKTINVISKETKTFLSKTVKSHTKKWEFWKFNKVILIDLFLRIGVFGTFLGHGINAILVKSSWIPLITAFGFSEDFAVKIMPFIGILDILVAICILIRPMKEILIWAIFWAFITVLSRPISGEPLVEFVERAANWVTPLILLFFQKQK